MVAVRERCRVLFFDSSCTSNGGAGIRVAPRERTVAAAAARLATADVLLNGVCFHGARRGQCGVTDTRSCIGIIWSASMTSSSQTVAAPPPRAKVARWVYYHYLQ